MGKQRRFGSISSKRQVLRSDKDVERLDDRREARAEGGRRFQREGAITAKDLDMDMVVLARGTKSSRLSMERRGRRDVAEVGNRMASRRYLGATPIWASRTISITLYASRPLYASRDWKPMEMFLDVVGDMGVTGKSGNESCSCVQYSLKGKSPGHGKTDQ